MRSTQRLLLGFVFSLATGSESFAANATVTVEAGEFDRQQTVVSFDVPAGVQATDLQGPQNRLLPLQTDGSRASFILPELAKGARATYKLVIKPGIRPEITLRREEKKLKVASGSHPLLEYQAEPGDFPRPDIKDLFRRGGYLHPILSPSGKMVTDDFPPNHIHHHGIWWAWTKTEFDGREPDFWNMGDGKGRVDFVAIDRSWSGPVDAGFIARNRFVDLTKKEPIVVLNEVWDVRVYNTVDPKRGWIFDLTSTQECATDKPLKLPEYRYGGIGLRGNRAWNGKENAHFLTSEGISDRIKGHATKARWCDMSGNVDGAQAGIAVLGHPENFRAPEPMRIHPDEPFFNFAPMQAGDMSIEPGKKYVWRYRFVVHDGAPDPKVLDAAWNDFANPPKVTVSN